MNTKYLVVGGIALVSVFTIGIGLYTYGTRDQNSSTLGAKNTIDQVTQNNDHNQVNSVALGGENNFSSMQAEEFKQALESGEYELIDVRTAEEFQAGHLANAFQIDFYQAKEFNRYLDSLDKNKKYLLYCRSGNRSGQALNIMKQKGFTNVSDLAGGYSAWTTTGFPIEN